MIDQEKLQAAYDENRFYSLQLEVGDRCVQGCVYCYMNALDQEKNTLSDELVDRVLEEAHRLGITAIEWLGGEPLLRKSVGKRMARAVDLGLRNNVWTGGLPLSDMSILKTTVKHARKGLIAVHLSTIDPTLYRILHPSRPSEDLGRIIDSVKEILNQGYPSEQMLNSVTFTGLQTADEMIRTIQYFQSEFGIKTSLNVYHSYLRPGTALGELKRFIPKVDEVRKVYDMYALQWGEKWLPMNCVNKQYCSTTLAVLCDGSITPCATIRGESVGNLHWGESLYDTALTHRDLLTIVFLRERENLPSGCSSCRLSDRCFGCRSRAYAAGRGIYGKDPGCFRTHIHSMRNE